MNKSHSIHEAPSNWNAQQKYGSAQLNVDEAYDTNTDTSTPIPTDTKIGGIKVIDDAQGDSDIANNSLLSETEMKCSGNISIRVSTTIPSDMSVIMSVLAEIKQQIATMNQQIATIHVQQEVHAIPDEYSSKQTTKHQQNTIDYLMRQPVSLGLTPMNLNDQHDNQLHSFDNAMDGV